MTDQNVISAAPFIADFKPYIDVLIEAVVGAVITLGAAKLNQWTNIKISDAQIAKLKGAAATEAGVLVANAEDNLSNRSVTVNSPIVVAAAQRIAAALPDTMTAAGATPEALQKFVAGEVGKLQAQTAPSAAPVAIVKAGVE
jgi:hypothetical protein